MIKYFKKLSIFLHIRYLIYKGYYPANIHGSKFKLNEENLDWWQKAINGNWEPETFKALSKFLTPESIYLDIGAWIGPTVLYAASKCKEVICFEPDRVAYQMLLRNIHLNKLENVTAYNIALSDKSSIQKMSSFGGKIGDSQSSLLPNQNSSTSFDALVLDWKFIEEIFNFNKIDFVKIDIEGGEFSLVPRLKIFFKKHQPIVWLSIHASFIEKSKRLEEVQKIIDVMSECYRLCLNSKLEEIDINQLKSEKYLNSFPVFLFKN